MIQVRKGGGAGPRIRYTRKSTEQADRQVASHEQQYDECDKHFGPVPEEFRNLWFRDDKSGTTFNRPAFRQMIDYCLANPQSGGARGRIEVYDHSRWGRSVRKDERGKIASVDPKGFYRWVYRLEDAGWDVAFTTESKSDDPLAHFLKEGIEVFIAGQKSQNLSREVRRGRLDWLRKGRWMGGPPPFPAKRIHPETGQLLPGTRAYNGGSLLAVDETKLPNWIRAAEMVLEGASLVAVAADFEQRGVPNYYTGRTKDGRLPRWTAQHIRKILTNAALVGKLHYEHDNEDTGEVRVEVIDAQWEPLVPVDLFNAVQRKLETDTTKVRRRTRKGVSSYAVPAMCARCGVYLAGTDLRQPDGTVHRRYRHISPRVNSLRREVRDRMVEAGCQTWVVDADEVENAVLELIASERGSPEFRQRIEQMLATGDEFAGAQQRRLEDARKEVARIEAAQERTMQLMTSGRGEGISDELFLRNLKTLQDQHAAAVGEYEEAAAMQEGSAARRASILERLDETDAVLRRWRSGDVGSRRAILDWWVDAVLIDFEKTARKPKGSVQRRSKNVGQRSARKKLVVFLATLPGEDIGMQVELRGSRGDTRQVGHREWDLVEVRTTLPPQPSEEPGTWRSPSESAARCQNDKSKTTGSACCTC
ncbi:MAG: recombinase family protein [Gemmatimonadota bacterium]